MSDLTQWWRDNPKYKGVPKQFAVLGVKYLPIAAGAVGQQADTRPVLDADFIMTAIYSVMYVPGGGYALVPMLVQFLKGQPLRVLVNQKPGDSRTEWATFCATGPKIVWTLAYPIVIPQRSVFSVILDNPSAAATNVFFAFHGFKAVVRERNRR